METNTTFEYRAHGESIKVEGNTLSGMAIPYNALSQDLGGFRERFAPGAVSEAITGGNVLAIAHHNMAQPLGDQTSGTLRLRDSNEGLLFDLDMPDASYANDMKALAKHSTNGQPVLRGMSFAFRTNSDGQEWKRDGDMNIRTVTKAELHHISPVIDPAYPQTVARLRSMENTGEDSLDLYGIDLERLTKILIARRKGLLIEESEMDLAKEAISLLRSAIRHPKLEQAVQQAAKVLL